MPAGLLVLAVIVILHLVSRAQLGVIDAEKKVRHSKLAERTEEVLTDPAKLKLKLKVRGGLTPCCCCFHCMKGPSR